MSMTPKPNEQEKKMQTPPINNLFVAEGCEKFIKKINLDDISILYYKIRIRKMNGTHTIYDIFDGQGKTPEEALGHALDNIKLGNVTT